MGRLPAGVAPRGFRGTENREDRRGVARGVEVFEIEAVVPGLVVVGPLERLRPHLELDRDDTRTRDQHGVDPPAEPRDIELEDQAREAIGTTVTRSLPKWLRYRVGMAMMPGGISRKRFKRPSTR